jgi:hypothetical protein
MARMLMKGGIPTPFIVVVAFHGICSVLQWESVILSQLPLEVFNNEQPLETLPK